MKPEILISGFALFCSCLALHAMIWRKWHPHKHALALLLVFFVPLLIFVSLAISYGSNMLHPGDIAAIGILHFSLACAYIQIYPAAQAFSPTLVILLLLGRAMPAGLTYQELRAHMDRAFLFGARVQDLLNADLVSENMGKLTLTSRGKRLLEFFILFRKGLGLGLGKG